jgi:hypothetical protein
VLGYESLTERLNVARLLYFPHICVPNNDWFTRSLLYWDRVVAMAPTALAWHPAGLEPFMRELIDVDLLELVVPMEHIAPAIFGDRFLRFAEATCLPRVEQGQRPLRHTYRVHIEKLGEVGRELCKMRLAAPDEWPWYRVEAFTAFQFMTYLAAYVAASPRVSAVPCTDYVRRLRPFAGLAEVGAEADIRAEVLGRFLPAPSGEVAPRDLVAFKEQNREMLQRFRRRVEALAEASERAPTHEIRDLAVEEFNRDARDDLSEIEEALTASPWPRISTGQFCALAGSGLELVKGLMNRDPVDAAVGGLGVLGLAAEAVRASFPLPDLNRHWTAYAVLAQGARIRLQPRR